MDKETLGALKELLSKIPKEDLEKAIKELSAEKLEQLSGGGFWDDFKSFLGFGRSSDAENRSSSPVPPPTAPMSSGPGAHVYVSNQEIRNAYLAGEIKGLRNLKNAYKSVHPSFKGSMQDVLAILNL